MSLSARRAWIEICYLDNIEITEAVALRKESVDRNDVMLLLQISLMVALRKESVDRNAKSCARFSRCVKSLSARRAWIEIALVRLKEMGNIVALRKESVDRNFNAFGVRYRHIRSLSARRAWIEIHQAANGLADAPRRSPQGERG